MREHKAWFVVTAANLKVVKVLAGNQDKSDGQINSPDLAGPGCEDTAG